MESEIEKLLRQVRCKKVLSRLIAAKYNKSPRSIYNNWVCGGFVPEKYQKEVLEFVKNYLKTEQNGKGNFTN